MKPQHIGGRSRRGATSSRLAWTTELDHDSKGRKYGVKHDSACLQAQHLVGQKQENQQFETKLDCIGKFHPKEKSSVDKNYGLTYISKSFKSN